MAQKARIFVIDDEQSIVDAYCMILEEEGYDCRGATDPQQALEEIEVFLPDAVLLDLRMPVLDGGEVFRILHRRDPDLPVIIITAHGDAATGFQFARQGAFQFIEKGSVTREILILEVRNAVETYQLKKSQREARHWGGTPRLLGDGLAMRQLRETIDKASSTQATVLILGESGSGKELVAWEIHRRSPRSAGPFVRVNCAAIPKELIESELFGHRKGAFTGAVADQKGKFEQANEGSIFLDEIGDMALETQAKILRVLETGEIEPLGEPRVRQVNVRVLAATNQNLQQLMNEQRFREDLYYRLAVLVIRVPSLREHPEDIPMLVEWFTQQFVEQNGMPRRRWEKSALEWLQTLPWPGNVRQLRHFVQYCLTMHGSPELHLKDIQRSLQEIERRRDTFETSSSVQGSMEPTTIQPLHKYLAQIEKSYLEKVLHATQGNVAHASRLLHIPRSNLYKKMEKYDIKMKREVE